MSPSEALQNRNLIIDYFALSSLFNNSLKVMDVFLHLSQILRKKLGYSCNLDKLLLAQ